MGRCRSWQVGNRWRVASGKWRVILLTIILLFGFISACRSSGETLERIRIDGVMRVGLDPTFPPFENGDYGNLEGIDVDLAHAIGREMGVDIEFIYLGYDGLYDALLIDQCDVLISALVIDETKTKDFAYSDPYFNVGQFLIVREDSDLKTLADFEGKILSVETGSGGHVEAISAQNEIRNLDIRTFPTPADAMWVVQQGETDGAIVDQVNARLTIQSQPGLILTEEPITVEPYGIVTQQDDEQLLDELNRILDVLKDSGELDEIIDHWLDGDA